MLMFVNPQSLVNSGCGVWFQFEQLWPGYCCCFMKRRIYQVQDAHIQSAVLGKLDWLAERPPAGDWNERGSGG